MKKLILIAIMLIFGQQGFAQIKQQIFKLDLSKPTATSLEIKDNREKFKGLVLPTKKLFAFEIINGNPFKYEYSINHKTINLYEDAKFEMPSEKTSKEGFGTGLEEATPIKPNKRLEELNNKKDSLNKLLNNESIIKSIVEKARWGTEIKLIESEVAKISPQKSYQSKSVYATSFLKNYELQKLAGQQNVKDALSNEQDKTNILQAIEALEKSFKTLSDTISNYIAANSVEDFLLESNLSAKRVEYNEIYSKLLVDKEKISKEACAFPDLLDKFNDKKKAIDTISSKIKEEMGKLYSIKMHHYTLPIDVNGKNIDLVEITVQRKLKKTTNAEPESYTYNIWLRGGVKIDVSAGAFITTVKSKTYQTEDKIVNVNGQDETHKLIYQDQNGKYDFGFGSLINVSLRSSSWVRPTLNIGALLTADEKFQFLAGGGVIFGKKERVVLHGGISMGSVTTIAKNFVSDGSKAYNLGSNGAVPTTNKFTFGHYIGFTYNFGKVKAAETTKK